MTLSRRDFIKQMIGSLSVAIAPTIETLAEDEANCLYGQDMYGEDVYNGTCAPTAISFESASTALPRTIIYTALASLAGAILLLRKRLFRGASL